MESVIWGAAVIIVVMDLLLAVCLMRFVTPFVAEQVKCVIILHASL